ncbi:hypothetical protein RHGRI_021116 [Rhododendron griersonianum]|uniref:CCHC-type domain-containing protein n=1 Tax=Rhododendron griersonianum TaxID=479676 RepID=A0AAV6JM14_9ERIC|nr:hypothetical protein RHGRI_021116 [Rhododendron griersonianum]
METVEGNSNLRKTTTSKPVEKVRSFVSALLKSRTGSNENLERNTLGLDADSDEEGMDLDPPKTKSRIKVEFSKEHLKRIRQQHKGCLIIKLLGKNIGFKALMDRITHLWSLEGLFNPVDLGLGFYLIRFESKSDYNKVYTGPRSLLTVRKWEPDFKADMANAIKTAVWMQFPFLPYEYYDEESLIEVAEKLGKPLKVDINTIEGLRASYPRVCVELDLSQPLEVSVAVRKYDYLIEYEHVHLICFSCGRVGHRREACNLSPSPAPEKNGEIGNQTVGDSANSASPDSKAVKFNGITDDGHEEIGYGEWMVVSRNKNKKPRPNALNAPGPQRNIQHNNMGGQYEAQKQGSAKAQAFPNAGHQDRPRDARVGSNKNPTEANKTQAAPQKGISKTRRSTQNLVLRHHPKTRVQPLVQVTSLSTTLY